MLHRVGGLVCLFLAAGFGWWGNWLPYTEALAGAPSVEFSTKIFVLVPFAAVFGLFFLIFGDSVPYRNVEKQTPTLAGLVLMLVAAGAGGFGFWWFDARFDELGYSVPGTVNTRTQVITPLPAGVPEPPAVPSRPG